MTLYELLMNIYKEYGFQKETTINVVRPGKSGAEEIQAMMKNFREHAPEQIAGSKVVLIKDYQTLRQITAEGEKPLLMPATSNVLQWFTESGLKVSVRPSGTEPKIKFYIEVPVEGFTGAADYDPFNAKADAVVALIKKDLGL